MDRDRRYRRPLGFHMLQCRTHGGGGPERLLKKYEILKDPGRAGNPGHEPLECCPVRRARRPPSGNLRVL